MNIPPRNLFRPLAQLQLYLTKRSPTHQAIKRNKRLNLRRSSQQLQAIENQFQRVQETAERYHALNSQLTYQLGEEKQAREKLEQRLQKTRAAATRLNMQTQKALEAAHAQTGAVLLSRYLEELADYQGTNPNLNPVLSQRCVAQQEEITRLTEREEELTKKVAVIFAHSQFYKTVPAAIFAYKEGSYQKAVNAYNKGGYDLVYESNAFAKKYHHLTKPILEILESNRNVRERINQGKRTKARLEEGIVRIQPSPQKGLNFVAIYYLPRSTKRSMGRIKQMGENVLNRIYEHWNQIAPNSPKLQQA